MADSNATSTVEAEYELFNRELGLDEGEPKVESTTAAEPEKSTETSTEKSEGDVSSSEKENPSEVEKQPEEKMDEGKSGEEKEATEETEKTEEVPEEEEEEEEEEEVIEDAEDVWDGEDPNDVEVEQFCQPSETSILEDMAEHSRKKKLLVYPVKMSEMVHPSILECINSCSEFRTTYVQSKQGSAEGSVGWTGILELLFKSAFAANEAIETLKAIREDVTVRLMELGENTKKMVDQWIVDTTMLTPRTIGHLMVVKRLPETVTLTELKDIFKESRDIILPKPRLGKRLAYVYFESEEKLKECHEKFTAERPVIGDVKLKVLLYQPPEVPQGLLRMKRRYRILLQIEQLKKSLKDKKAKHSPQTIKKIESTIENCTSLIERDDKAREKVNLPLLTLRELKSIKPVRESVQPDTIWLPGVSGGPGKRDSFMEFDHDEDDHGSNDRHGSRWSSNKRWERERDHRPMSRPGGNTSGVPSLLDMSMNMGPNFNPIARVQEIAAKIAQMACNIPRGGGGGGGGGGMRGGRGGSSGPGGFGQGGRGGGGGGRGFGGDFQHRDSGFHGGKGGSMGGGRGGSSGGGSGSYGNRSSFNNNKRSRSPPKSRDDDSSSNAGDGKSDTFEPAGKVAKQDGDKSSQWGNKNRFGSGGSGGGMGNFSRNNDYNKGGMGGNQRGGGSQRGGGNNQRGGGGNQRGGGNFQSGSNQKGGFNQGGFNQGTGAAAANQGTVGAYNQGTGAYNQGNQAQQATGAYNQAQGTYNQAANQTGAQGTTGYNQAAAATYNQAGAYNQAGYNQGYNQAGYNQAYPGYNAAGGYNYDYSQYNQAGYNMQGAGYGYNYPVGYPAQGQQATQQQGQQWTAGTTATTGQQQTAQQPAAATQSTDWSQQGQQQQQTAWPAAMPQTTADASAAGATANQNAAAYQYNWNAAATTWPTK